MILELSLFLVWGLMWAIYFVLDGFDLGIGITLPFLGKTTGERKVLINTMGPFWDGNEVWLIAAGAFTFGAFPIAYAKMFSLLYTPLMLLLFALILRGVSIEFRSKVADLKWMAFWEWVLFISSFLAALLLGVAFSNIFRGLVFNGGEYAGTLSLFNPYGLLGGVLFVVIFVLHGLLWAGVKTNGEIHNRAVRVAKNIWPIVAIVAVAFLVFTWFDTKLYDKYLAYPVLLIVPVAAVAGLLCIRVFIGKREWMAWFSSSLFILATAVFGVVGIYPYILPFRNAEGLTVNASASSQPTLMIMAVVAAIIVPLVIFYQIWAYRLFSHKVREHELSPTNSY